MEKPVCCSRLSRFGIRDWPEPKSMAFLETLAKYDVDTAVRLILCREKFIVKEVYKYLDYQDMLRDRRRELLYQKWAVNVRDPLQQLITQKVAATHLTAKEKLEAADNYLKYSNKRGRAFIDHYDPREYDPFLMRNKDPAYLKVIVPLFRDPTLVAQQGRDEENRAILQCETGKRYTMKEFKEVEKARKLEKLPPFSFARARRCPTSAPPESRGFARSRVPFRAHARPGTTGRSRDGPRHFPILEDTLEKAMSSACSTLSLDEVGSTRASSKAAEAWAHRPALLRSRVPPASHKVRHAYQERPAYIPSVGQALHWP
ncbi:protein FAM228B-like [Antechinus flavipes]|uniref:protein FAM228B-like n=1 Tax=Antechinus flavipes TaxID=38775 RepID=UPI002236293D|nr:protein FAM228B-like [Antechinus flavipes]